MSTIGAWLYPVIEADARHGRTPKVWDLEPYWVSVSNTRGVSGVQGFSITLPGRSYVGGQRSVPWEELFLPGDLAYIEGQSYSPDGVYTRGTTADGVVVSVEADEPKAANSYRLSTTVNCESMMHFMARDNVAYWIYQGSIKGFARAKAELPMNDLSANLASAFSTYVDKVAFIPESFSRAGGLKNRLSYSFRSLEHKIPPVWDFAIAEGTHYSILNNQLDPLHTLYAVPMPAGDVGKGAMFSSVAGVTRGEDSGTTCLVLKPFPYPFANPGGGGNTSEWSALNRYDVTQLPVVPVAGRSGKKSYLPVFNFFMAQPRFMGLTEGVAIAAHIAVQNKKSQGDDGFAPLKFGTKLMFDAENVDDNKLLDIARELSWRAAGQNNKLDTYRSGSYTLPFLPTLQPGQRILANAPLGDTTMLLEAYIDSVTDLVQLEGGSSSTVSYTRGLSPDLYASPGYFVDGLSEVEIIKPSDRVSQKDGL